MTSRFIVPVFLLGALALACGTRSDSGSSVTPPTTETAVRHTEKTATAGNAPIRSALQVRAEPKAVHFAFDLTNAGKKHVELTFPSGQEYDFLIKDAAGREVYRWGAGRMFTQALQNRVLDSGETMRIDASAETTLPPGTYVAVATLRSSNYPLEERVEFELR